jgi:hypothetical protein
MGGADPFLDRPFEDWLRGAPVFVAEHPLLNRLCRAGTLAPGEYAVTRSRGPIRAGMEDGLGVARAPYSATRRYRPRQRNRAVRADVLAGNTPMLAVLCNSGLRMRTSYGQGVVHATLFLT